MCAASLSPESAERVNKNLQREIRQPEQRCCSTAIVPNRISLRHQTLNFLRAKCYPQRLGILRNYRWSGSLTSLDHTRDEQQKRRIIEHRNLPWARTASRAGF